ncbi:serine/threonine protein kinase [Alkalihalobacillus hwajinpoensis]|uniref:serine/threonine protein kinase n=1 Tax=Guptibacillus hwajinpoensis TaxID=208199 RepID=UPI001883CF7D|nr:serine/threonine protein kinase [Pseudalkalibacillus hwajinpoensis]MBF0709390.1 serine/threonine protein kinase [Pseudalkalibacillus hwajinpoensis]
MKDEFRDEQLPKWKDMIQNLFEGEVPVSKEWYDKASIVKVLNFVGEYEALNHTFLPNGGGLDLHGCSFSNESQCIELDLGGIAHVLKPKKLTFQWFPNADYEWAYFLLESETLKSSGVYEELFYDEEELVEISPGEYIERAYWDEGYFDGERLPKEARLIGRYLSGSLAIFSKASLYNKNSRTYDGRHSTMSPEAFRNHIKEVVMYLNEQDKK